MTAETPTPDLQSIQELESRQDEVLRQLNELVERLDGVLQEYADAVALSAQNPRRLAA